MGITVSCGLTHLTIWHLLQVHLQTRDCSPACTADCYVLVSYYTLWLHPLMEVERKYTALTLGNVEDTDGAHYCS